MYGSREGPFHPAFSGNTDIGNFKFGNVKVGNMEIGNIENRNIKIGSSRMEMFIIIIGRKQ